VGVVDVLNERLALGALRLLLVRHLLGHLRFVNRDIHPSVGYSPAKDARGAERSLKVFVSRVFDPTGERQHAT
jgi:hypothetical protein